MTIDYTGEAQSQIGDYVQRAGKTFLVVSVVNVFGDEVNLKITTADAVRFFSSNVNAMSGCRVLAGRPGDWRPLTRLAEQSLQWFKLVDEKSLRRLWERAGLVPTVIDSL